MSHTQHEKHEPRVTHDELRLPPIPTPDAVQRAQLAIYDRDTIRYTTRIKNIGEGELETRLKGQLQAVLNYIQDKKREMGVREA